MVLAGSTQFWGGYVVVLCGSVGVLGSSRWFLCGSWVALGGGPRPDMANYETANVAAHQNTPPVKPLAQPCCNPSSTF